MQFRVTSSSQVVASPVYPHIDLRWQEVDPPRESPGGSEPASLHAAAPPERLLPGPQPVEFWPDSFDRGYSRGPGTRPSVPLCELRQVCDGASIEKPPAD